MKKTTMSAMATLMMFLAIALFFVIREMPNPFLKWNSLGVHTFTAVDMYSEEHTRTVRKHRRETVRTYYIVFESGEYRYRERARSSGDAIESIRANRRRTTEKEVFRSNTGKIEVADVGTDFQMKQQNKFIFCMVSAILLALGLIGCIWKLICKKNESREK